MSPNNVPLTGLVLAAGGSKRLGRPKQLLPYGPVPLLAHVLQAARECDFHQLLCVLGAGAEAVLERIDFDGVTVVKNRHFGDGCSSSIAAALSAVDARSEGVVLLLGDQPGVSAATVATLVAQCRNAPLAACGYRDGRGHPLLFARSMFGELVDLHGDKGVWRLLDRHAEEVVDVPVEGRIPLDVDTWEDYRSVLVAAASSGGFRTTLPEQPNSDTARPARPLTDSNQHSSSERGRLVAGRGPSARRMHDR